MSTNLRPTVQPLELIFEFLFDAEGSVRSASRAAELHVIDLAVAAELATLAEQIAAVRARFDVPPDPHALEEGEGNAQWST